MLPTTQKHFYCSPHDNGFCLKQTLFMLMMLKIAEQKSARAHMHTHFEDVMFRQSIEWNQFSNVVSHDTKAVNNDQLPIIFVVVVECVNVICHEQSTGWESKSENGMVNGCVLIKLQSNTLFLLRIQLSTKTKWCINHIDSELKEKSPHKTNVASLKAFAILIKRFVLFTPSEGELHFLFPIWYSVWLSIHDHHTLFLTARNAFFSPFARWLSVSIHTDLFQCLLCSGRSKCSFFFFSLCFCTIVTSKSEGIVFAFG